jgi:hypothetical protein
MSAAHTLPPLTHHKHLLFHGPRTSSTLVCLSPSRCLVHPSSVLQLCMRPQPGGEETAKLVGTLMRWFGAQAMLVGLVFGTSIPTKVTYRAFGLAMLPFLVGRMSPHSQSCGGASTRMTCCDRLSPGHALATPLAAALILLQPPCLSSSPTASEWVAVSPANRQTTSTATWMARWSITWAMALTPVPISCGSVWHGGGCAVAAGAGVGEAAAAGGGRGRTQPSRCFEQVHWCLSDASDQYGRSISN